MELKSSGFPDRLHDLHNGHVLNGALLTRKLFMKAGWSREASRDQRRSVRWDYQFLVIWKQNKYPWVLWSSQEGIVSLTGDPTHHKLSQ